MKCIRVLSLFIITLTFFACDPDSILNNDSSKTENSETATDYNWNNSSEIPVVLNGTSVSVNSDKVEVSGTTVTIKQAGYFNISGTLSNGQIIVETDTGIVKIKLSGASITNNNGSPFYIKKAEKTVLFLDSNTSSVLTDATSYGTTGEPNATLFSNSYLAITGDGTLTIKGNYNDGISGDDEIIINNGIINVSAKDDAIRGKNFLRISNGTITASASSGHALKSDNEVKSGYGYIEINGGTLHLSSTYADGIHGVKRVIINGGTSLISAPKSQGLKSDSLVTINGGNISVTSSNEGIESPYIKIIGGDVSILATDDGLNASFGNGGENNDNSMITISGGDIYINPTTGDGLDSNGNITMTGGNMIVHGPERQPEVGLDYNGTFNLNGGFFVVSGTSSNMTQGAGTGSSQNSLKITTSTSISSATLFHIQDASGNNVLSFKPIKTFSSIIFSSSVLTKGATYSIYTGGTCTGSLTNGVYTGGTYSGGTLKKSFTISSTVSSITF